jgi:hypothetical protein
MTVTPETSPSNARDRYRMMSEHRALLPRGPSAAIIRILLAAGSPVPETLWDDAPGPLTMLAELGVSLD